MGVGVRGGGGQPPSQPCRPCLGWPRFVSFPWFASLTFSSRPTGSRSSASSRFGASWASR
eukprot:4413886-Prymnesium_polylepis.1